MPPRRPSPSSSAPPELTISFTRARDGDTIFRLTRADGTATWQRTRGATGAFFPPHDLTHYAVETALRHARGFYGLVADGWDLDDLRAPWPRGRLVDIDPSELIVGFLDRTGLADGTTADAAALNATAVTFFAAPRADAASAAGWRPVGTADLAAVRARPRARCHLARPAHQRDAHARVRPPLCAPARLIRSVPAQHGHASPAVALALHGIVKQYGAVRALDGASSTRTPARCASPASPAASKPLAT